MKHYIYKSPYKPGDTPIEIMKWEPNDFIVGLKAKKYGSIEIISEEDVLIRERNAREQT